MKIGLVGYQGSGKSACFELLTGAAPDPSKMQSGQVGVAVVPNARFDGLVALYNPKKQVPAKIELFDTPGLDPRSQEGNAKRLGVIREAAVLVHVIGAFTGADAAQVIAAFESDLILADLQVVSNRIHRLQADVKKPRPDRDKLQEEMDCLQPVLERLDSGQGVRDMEFTDAQDVATKSFSLLSRKPQIILLNTQDSNIDRKQVEALEAKGHRVVAGPVGLELEIMALDEADRAEFAAEMGLTESCRDNVLKAIFEVTDLITFFTSGEKEVHAWLLKRGSTVVEAADTIHSDLARGFVRAEIMAVDDLLRLGSERELKAAGLNHIVGKDYIVKDGDEILIRSGL